MSARTLSGLRARLHVPGSLFFAQTMFPDPGVSAILGGCGFDFVMLDAEHGPFTLTTLRPCIEALKATMTAVVVRTASQSEVEIKQTLDLGADGVIVPRIESADQIISVIRAARYGPEGVRGVSRAVRASRFGLDEDYVQSANARVVVATEGARLAEEALTVARDRRTAGFGSSVEVDRAQDIYRQAREDLIAAQADAAAAHFDLQRATGDIRRLVETAR